MPRAVVILLLVFSALAPAQVEITPMASGEDPRFFFDALVFAGKDSATSRLDTYIQVPYDALSFVQKPDGYEANYEESITIFDEKNNLVREKLSTERVRTSSFAETTDPARYNLTQRVLYVAPNSYTAKIQIRDSETRKSLHGTRQIVVRSMRDSALTMSDIMLVSQLRSDEGKMTIVPNVSGNVGNMRDGFYLFCEVYNATDADTFDVESDVFDAKGEKKLSDHYRYAAVRGDNRMFVKILSGPLPMARYVANLRVGAWSSAAHRVCGQASVSRAFVVQWPGIPATVQSVDAAVDQLQYLTDDKNLDSLREAPDAAEKKARFLRFWARRDPSPGTLRNEAMEEYYNRVAYANKNFSHFIEGWRTDRGMVYIIFGPPSRVDRYPFESDAKPYEYWYYDDLNYRFLFVDDTGFGDYRLDPATPIWELRTRRR
jgi:GWxTD domain-containing protein